MKGMSVESNTMDARREFFTHAQGWHLNRFNEKHEEIMINLMDDGSLASTYFKEIASFVITGFGRANHLKCENRDMITTNKSCALAQDDF